MKLTVFGATGGVGRQVVRQALEEGYEVLAFSRSPEKLEMSHEKLRVLKGDVHHLESVIAAVQGQDAVISTLGAPLSDRSKLRARGTKAIVQAMEKSRVKRLISLSALGVGESRSLLPFHYKALIIPLVMGRLYEDHQDQEQHIAQSGLDWTIVRPGSFVRGQRSGNYSHGTSLNRKSLKAKISRADVADFLLRQLKDDHYIGKSPCISY